MSVPRLSDRGVQGVCKAVSESLRACLKVASVIESWWLWSIGWDVFTQTNVLCASCPQRLSLSLSLDKALRFQWIDRLTRLYNLSDDDEEELLNERKRHRVPRLSASVEACENTAIGKKS